MVFHCPVTTINTSLTENNVAKNQMTTLISLLANTCTMISLNSWQVKLNYIQLWLFHLKRTGEVGDILGSPPPPPLSEMFCNTQKAPHPTPAFNPYTLLPYLTLFTNSLPWSFSNGIALMVRSAVLGNTSQV